MARIGKQPVRTQDQRGGRAKKYCKVTAKGLREIRETQRTLLQLWRGLPELQGGTA